MNEVIVTISGNVVTDPIYRVTSNGDAFVTFRVAVNERKRSADGTWIPGESQYFSVTAFRLLASNAAQSLKRGQLVSVTGRLRITRYEDKEKNQRTSVQIEAHDIAASMKFHRVTATPSTKVDLPVNDKLGDEEVAEATREVEESAHEHEESFTSGAESNTSQGEATQPSEKDLVAA